MASVAQGLSAVGAGAALEWLGVTRLFGALAALTDVTLTVRAGERRAVLGSNGAGKTTLFNAITGDFPPTKGRIQFFGEDVTRFPVPERIRRGPGTAHPPRGSSRRDPGHAGRLPQSWTPAPARARAGARRRSTIHPAR